MLSEGEVLEAGALMTCKVIDASTKACRHGATSISTSRKQRMAASTSFPWPSAG